MPWGPMCAQGWLSPLLAYNAANLLHASSSWPKTVYKSLGFREFSRRRPEQRNHENREIDFASGEDRRGKHCQSCPRLRHHLLQHPLHHHNDDMWVVHPVLWVCVSNLLYLRHHLLQHPLDHRNDDRWVVHPVLWVCVKQLVLCVSCVMILLIVCLLYMIFCVLAHYGGSYDDLIGN
jgi:hypothetical protein